MILTENQRHLLRGKIVNELSLLELTTFNSLGKTDREMNGRHALLRRALTKLNELDTHIRKAQLEELRQLQKSQNFVKVYSVDFEDIEKRLAYANSDLFRRGASEIVGPG